MGDYLLDFRNTNGRSKKLAPRMQYFSDMRLFEYEYKYFYLAITISGTEDLWRPFVSPDGTVLAIAGKPAFAREDLLAAKSIQGQGGLACKAAFRMYTTSGLDSLKSLGGGFAIHIYQRTLKKYHLILDSLGCYPIFCLKKKDGLVFSSHSDLLAESAGVSEQLDLVSMGTFLSLGYVTTPNTYYKKVESIDYASMLTFYFDEERRISTTIEFKPEMQFASTDEYHEYELAEQITESLRTSVRATTSGFYGQTFIGLSGGLDSRLIAGLTENKTNLSAFCIRGKTLNKEFCVANNLSAAIGIPMFPLIREFDHYIDSADLGAFISGGMGSLTSNHFLGFRGALRQLGCENLITGCYFDYIFKSLSLDVLESRILRREQRQHFSNSSYLQEFDSPTSVKAEINFRLAQLFPEQMRRYASDNDRLMAGFKRTFPLWREGDNIQRLVFQRAFSWYSPVVSPEILNLYFQISLDGRMNKNFYRKVVEIAVHDSIKCIVDNNTGFPVGAGVVKRALGRYATALRRRAERRSAGLDTHESWINWRYYLATSRKVKNRWLLMSNSSRELVETLTGMAFSEDIEAYNTNKTPEYFMRLLTLAVWLDQRKKWTE